MPVQTAALLQKVKRLLGKAAIVTYEMGIQITFLPEHKANDMLCCDIYLFFLNSTIMSGYHHSEMCHPRCVYKQIGTSI